MRAKIKKSKTRLLSLVFLSNVFVQSLCFIAPLVTVRRCAQCKETGHEKFTTLTSFQMHHCDICESFLWDHDGK